MNKEIKEILHELDCHGVLNGRQDRDLLNYITNLQTIEQQYSAILSENAELENKITNLQEQLYQASLDIQELTEKDIWCPSNCDKLTNLQEIEKDHQRINGELRQQLKQTEEIAMEYKEEIERLNNIIKEAREFIKYDIKQLKGSEYLLRKLDLKELLEILDKGE